jgi:proteasome accessory factor C
MDEHRRLFRIFQVIARLRSPLGCSKQELAEDYDVDVRTIERYFKLLRELGFDIVRVKNVRRYKIENLKHGNIKPEDLIVFTLEEASAVKDALLKSKITGPLQKSLLDKLYALTDLDELSETLYKQSVSKNISDIRFAIKNHQQVILQKYQSVSSNEVSERVVEPLRFHAYYRYLIAWEVESQMIKQYKTERITGVKLTGLPYRYKEKHAQVRVDIFGMSGTNPIPVKLYLSRRARLLMEEEFPEASLYLKTKRGMDYFDGEVFSLEGIGRYILGLIDEIEVTAPKALKDYVRNKIRRSGLVS